MTAALQLWYLVVGAFWAWRAIRACAALRHVPFLAPAAGAALDRVTAVAVARDASSARTMVESLRAQDGLVLEIVVVDATDDHSVASLAGDGVVVEAAGTVPDGWLPRSHALAKGVERATSADWLLLLDEPVRFRSRDAVLRVLAHAQRTRADSLAIVPSTPAGWLTPLVLSGLVDAMPSMAATNRDRATIPWLGPVHLVRSRALADIGGFEAVRMAPVAELMLGELLREDGRPMRVVQAQDEAVLARPIDSAALVETLERLLGVVGFRFLLLAIALGCYALLWCSAIAAPLGDSPWGMWAFGGLLAQVIPGLWIASAHRTPWPAALLVPFTLPVEVAMSIVTAIRLKLRRGVTWQGCFVPLEALRNAARERGG